MIWQRAPSSRRLAVWLAIVALLPLAGLSWFGWNLVRDIRDGDAADRRERAGRYADLAIDALDRYLDDLEARLSAWGSGASEAESLAPAPADATVMVVLDRGGIVRQSGRPLPFVPRADTHAAPGAAMFSRVSHLELRDRDFHRAAAVLEPLADDPDASVRAEALLRLARNYARAGDIARAVAAFERLEALGDTRVAELPAGYAAYLGRVFMYESAALTADVERSRAAFTRGLEDGRWSLTRRQYEAAVAKATSWDVAPVIDSESVARAETIELVWREWLAGGSPSIRHWKSVSTGAGSRAVAAVVVEGRLALVAVDSASIERLLSATLSAAAAGDDTSWRLTDLAGAVVAGETDMPGHDVAMTSASGTLPWTVHMAVVSTGADVSGRVSVLLLVVVGMAAIVVVAAAYVSGRAITREVAAAHLQSEFVATVSHEFRTPLTTLRQLSEMLARGRVSGEQRRQEFYDTLVTETARLHRLVEGLLQFGRAEAGAAAPVLESIDVGALAAGVVAEFTQESGKALPAVTISVSGTGMVTGDRVALDRAIWNLIENAVKHSASPSPVDVSVATDEGHVTVSVRDRGVGIPARELPTLFDRFTRGRAAHERGVPGTGVGLALVRRVAEAHAGRVTAESSTGHGSVFTITLPLVVPATDGEEESGDVIHPGR